MDAESKLPYQLTATGFHEREQREYRVRFDYPQSGPADIFALGVPADVELVDRVPARDIKTLLAGVEANRDRFDDYRALVVTYPRDAEYWWTTARIEIIHRKGNWMRRDSAIHPRRSDEPPEDDARLDQYP